VAQGCTVVPCTSVVAGLRDAEGRTWRGRHGCVDKIDGVAHVWWPTCRPVAGRRVDVSWRASRDDPTGAVPFRGSSAVSGRFWRNARGPQLPEGAAMWDKDFGGMGRGCEVHAIMREISCTGIVVHFGGR
jgi:hypothetical protein